MNQLLDEICRCVVQVEGGLQVLRFKSIAEKNRIEGWCLSQFANKASACHTLELSNFSYFCSEENRAALLEMAGQVCLMSNCLSTLIVRDTKTTAEQGQEFLQTLAD